MAQIEISGVAKGYGNRRTPGQHKRALADVSLSIRDQEFFTLLGPSGCGKTTLLRAIAGFFQIDAGTIAIDTRTVSDPRRGLLIPPERRDLGMVFQSYAVWPHMTVGENVAYPLSVRKVPRVEVRERVRVALQQVRLNGLEDRRSAQLSGGQQQRVALARALVMKPTALLLDEPLSNLDARLRAQMRFELKELQRRLALTIVYVTHDQEEALAMSDRIAVLSDGHVVQLGTPEEIHDRPASEFVARFLGRTSIVTGTVKKAGDHLELAIAGDVLRVAATPDLPRKEGAPVVVSLRHSALEINAHPREERSGESGTLSGRLRVSTFMGDYRLHEVDLDDGQVVVAASVLDDAPPPAPGARVRLSVRRVHAFRSS